jgi:hypothetical protein
VAPGPAYFRTAVRQHALRLRLYAWAKHVVAMDPEDVLYAEQAMARGDTSSRLVRLPAGCPG